MAVLVQTLHRSTSDVFRDELIMPTPNLPYIQFIGGRSDPKRQEYLNTLLKAIGVPDGVKQILVESPIGMRQARQMYQVPDNRPAFSSYQDGRVYIDDNTLDNPKMIHDYLLHEFGHFAAKAYPKKGNEDRLSNNQMQAMEQAAEKGAQPYRDAFKLFQSKAGRAYQAEQARVDSDAGKIQPVPVNYSQTLDGQPPKLSISNLTQGSLQGALHGLAQK